MRSMPAAMSKLSTSLAPASSLATSALSSSVGGLPFARIWGSAPTSDPASNEEPRC